jgi:hypothetical protein
LRWGVYIDIFFFRVDVLVRERKRGRGVKMETRGSGIGKESGNGGKERVYKQHITPLIQENKIIETRVMRRYGHWQVSTGF